MELYKVTYVLGRQGEILLQNVPFPQGAKVEIVVSKASEEKDNVESWRQEYLKRILSSSVWSEEDIQRIEEAQKDWNQWQIPQLS
jgi:hypothetical protein